MLINSSCSKLFSTVNSISRESYNSACAIVQCAMCKNENENDDRTVILP